MGNPPRQNVVIARVRRPHGIRGKLLVEDLTGGAFAPEQGTELGFGFDTGLESIKLAKIKGIPGGYIYTLEGYSRREQVENFRNVYIEVDVNELPEIDSDEFYYFELIGLPVYDTAGSRIGEIKGVSDMAGGILEIETDNGEMLVPFAKKHVKEIEPGIKIVIEDIPWSGGDEG